MVEMTIKINIYSPHMDFYVQIPHPKRKGHGMELYFDNKTTYDPITVLKEVIEDAVLGDCQARGSETKRTDLYARTIKRYKTKRSARSAFLQFNNRRKRLLERTTGNEDTKQYLLAF